MAGMEEALLFTAIFSVAPLEYLLLLFVDTVEVSRARASP